MQEKIMHFANFNITFGENEEPMLTHFEDFVFPAFTGGLIRGKEDSVLKFTFSDVEIKYIGSEYVMVGNYIKDTQYTIHTTYHDGELQATPADVPTAPYSRFIIFLKNHRMILFRNESASPDIRSFQKTVRDILNQYRRKQNKDRQNKLPISIVNIVDMPLKENLEELLRSVKKIERLKLRFFPLNNDINPLPLANAINQEMKNISSKTANMIFNSPESKEGVQRILEETTGSGLATTTMKVEDSEGQKQIIKEDKFSSNKKIPFAKDIEESDDETLVSYAQNNPIINKTSEENNRIYERCIDIFHKLVKRE